MLLKDPTWFSKIEMHLVATSLGACRVFCSLKCFLNASLMAGVLFFGFTSCASYTDKTREMREAYSAGQYDRALEALKNSGIMESSQDRLLWRLEAATILDRKGEEEKSRKLWFEADQIADELFTLSVSNTAKSLVVSESSQDYEGEDYEKVAIHAMLAHQYIGLGKLDEARVEARKINNKLAEINEKYDEKNKNKYGEDAHARYLSGIIYEARGELDSAIIDYTKALELYEGAFGRYIKGPVPHGLIKGLYRVLSQRNRSDRIKQLTEKYKQMANLSSVQLKEVDSAEIVVVHEVGRIARKVAKEFFITVGNQLVRFSFPSLEPRPLMHGNTGVEVRGVGFYDAENTAYLDAIAVDTLENRRARMVAKQMVRLLAKGQLNYQAQKNFGLLGGLAANAFTAASETADTRSWTTLPQGFFITRAKVPAGEQEIVVKTNGRVSLTKKVNIKKGQILLFRGWE